MSPRAFVRLNDGWNAEPNAPEADVEVEGRTVRLRFILNHQAYPAAEDERASLVFAGSRLWRLGSTNDEGWYRGQCRYSELAPSWGEFYEVTGEDALGTEPIDWQVPSSPGAGKRHFLFYLRDQTFECFADSWSLERVGKSHRDSAIMSDKTGFGIG